MWTGIGQPRQIVVLDIPSLYCDICRKELLGKIPDGSRISRTGKWSSFGGEEYRIEPSLNTPEWLAEAQAKGGWIDKTLFGKHFTVCRECSAKESGTANAEPTSQEPTPEAKEK